MKNFEEEAKALARGHYYSDDSWYSCPLATDGCADKSQGDKCDCGYDDRVADILKALSRFRLAMLPLTILLVFSVSLFRLPQYVLSQNPVPSLDKLFQSAIILPRLER